MSESFSDFLSSFHRSLWHLIPGNEGGGLLSKRKATQIVFTIRQLIQQVNVYYGIFSDIVYVICNRSLLEPHIEFAAAQKHPHKLPAVLHHLSGSTSGSHFHLKAWASHVFPLSRIVLTVKCFQSERAWTGTLHNCYSVLLQDGWAQRFSVVCVEKKHSRFLVSGIQFRLMPDGHWELLEHVKEFFLQSASSAKEPCMLVY